MATHPKTKHFVDSGLFTALSSFRDLETQISAPEGFVQIEGHPEYFISREGEVWSRKSRRLLSRVKNDYLDVNLDGVTRRVHVLVARAFLPNPAPDRLKVVKHKDDSRYNCSVDNLEWGTQSANASDAVDHGVYSPGWNFRELTDEKVLAIHQDIVSGALTQQRIAEVHCVSYSTVNAIKHGRIHRRLTKSKQTPCKQRIGPDHHNAKLSVEQVQAIWARSQAGGQKTSLSREYGVSVGAIESICYGRTWNAVTNLPKRPRRAALGSQAPRIPKRRASRVLQRALPPSGLVAFPVEELSDEYGLTPEGLVYSYVSHALLSPQTKGKYPKVKITHQGKTYNFLLHRLLALAFIPNPSGHTVVRHLDDNPRNYSLSNLAWGEVEHNTADAIANGILSGTVLTDQQLRELIARVDSGELTQMEAANMYNVPFQSVSRWMLGQSRKESTGRAEVSPGMRCGEKNPAATLSSEQLRELVATLQSGNYTQREVAKQFRVSTACVSRIKNGKTRSTETGLAGNGERA